MKVIMLTRLPDEAREHARLAGLAMSDVIIPGSERNLMGLTLSSSDLIVEFPSFGAHPREQAIRETLRRSLLMTKASPPWHKVGQRDSRR